MKSLFIKRDTPFIYNKYYLCAQDRWARKMNALTRGLSKRTLLCLMVLFIALSGGYLLYNIYAAFSSNGAPGLKTTANISKIKAIQIKK